MLKNDNELLIKILDDYCSGATHSLEMLAKRNGISTRTLFVWLRDKEITLDYMGRENITFGEAMKMARNVAKAIIVSRTLEAYVAEGRRCEIFHHGRPQFEEDEALVALGEDFVLNVLGLPDMYKRDLNGNRIIATRIEYAPAALIEKYASSNLPGIYGDRREITMRGNVSLGVTQMPAPPLPPLVQTMMTGETITETVKLAAPTTDTPEQFEVEPDPEVIGPAGEPEAVEMAPEPQIIRDLPPKDFIKPATPKAIGVAEVPLRAPRSELERDLFSRLAAAREKAQ